MYIISLYNDYKTLIEKINEDREEIVAKQKCVNYSDYDLVSSLHCADLYALSINAIREKHCYILKNGQRIRYNTLIKNIPYDFLSADKRCTQRNNIERDSFLFTTSIEEVDSMIKSMEHNNNLAKDIKTVDHKLAIVRSKMEDIKTHIYANIESDFILHSFDSPEEYINKSIDNQGKRISLVDFENEIKNIFPNAKLISGMFQSEEKISYTNQENQSVKINKQEVITALFEKSKCNKIRKKLFIKEINTICEYFFNELID